MNHKPPGLAAAPAANDDRDSLVPPELEPVGPRVRWDGWTPNREAAFIQVLAESGCVEDASRAVGMSSRSAYALRAHADAISFRNARRARRHRIELAAMASANIGTIRHSAR